MTAWPFEFGTRAAVKFGRLAQLVRALPSHGRGQRFKSFVAHHPFRFSHFFSDKSEQEGILCLKSVRYRIQTSRIGVSCPLLPPCVPASAFDQLFHSSSLRNSINIRLRYLP